MGWAGEEEGKGERKGREGEVEEREREGPQVTVESGPLRALLRHCLQQSVKPLKATFYAQTPATHIAIIQ